MISRLTRGRLPMLLAIFMLVLYLGQPCDAAHQRAGAANRSDVFIAGFFPLDDGVENSDTGRGVKPSVYIALDHVREHSNILTDYALHMWWNDTKCSAAVGVKSFFDMVHSGQPKVMLFGAACTHVTDPIAKASKHWHLTQLSYADTHPMFTKDAFPNFFRVVPSENAFNAPRLALMRHFNWTRVGTIYQNEPRYSLPHNHMVADLDAMDVEVVETQSFVTDVRESLQKLLAKDVRIILGNFNEHWARHVFCEAHRLNMFGRSYQWLIMGTYSENWWNVTSNCEPDEIEAALESTIMTDLLPLSTTGDITVAGITAKEYLEEYDSRRGNEYSRFHGYTYDGIWAVALAIQYVADHSEMNLSQFKYHSVEWENIFLEALRNTSFEGVTGPVRFYNNERRPNILLKQFQHGQEVKIGEYNALQDQLDFTRAQPIKWNGQGAPKDRTRIKIEHAQVNLTIYSVLASLSVFGIVMAFVFLGFNIRYRDQRYIKMSSPHLNNLIIIGCILTYLSVIFLGLDSGLSSVAAFPYICTARAWLLMAGFSFSFGAMFSKTWRVHSIFTDVKLNKKVIKDYQLFIVVGILLFIDVLILTTWHLADPFYRDIKHIIPVSNNVTSLDDVIVVQENEYCQSNRITIFISIIYAYKGLLLVFGAFLAWETRHVNIPALNDSKHIGMSVYNVLIMCIMGAAIALVLSDHKDAVFVIISCFIIFCTSGTLCLVFVPKLVEMRRNPQGQVDKRVRATLRPMSKNRRDSSVSELEHRMREVKSTNCRFRKTLIDKEAELQSLIRKIGAESMKWIDGINCDTEPLINSQTKLSVPIGRREAISTTEITELTSVGSVTSTFAEHENGTLTTDSRVNKAPTQIAAVTVDVQAQTPKTNGRQMAPIASTAVIINNNNHNNTNNNNNNGGTPITATPNTPGSRSRVSCISNVSTDTFTNNNASISLNIEELPPPLPAKEKKAENLYIKNKHMQSPGGNKQKDIDNHSSSHRKSSSAQVNALTHSNSELNTLCPHGKGSAKNLNLALDHRRVSVGTALKSNFVVSQSDLWDTHTLSQAKQRQSPRHHAQSQRCQEHSHLAPTMSAASYNDALTTSTPSNHQAPIQRSVSEKNRTKHRHKSAVKQLISAHSETDSEREREPPSMLSSAAVYHQGGAATLPDVPLFKNSSPKSRALFKSMQHAHHHSTPNVAPGSEKRKYRNKTPTTANDEDADAKLFGASSESELLDGDKAMLPIFRKLLTERQPRYRSSSRSNGVGASCPNISIKCDIVEYL